jgi:hypothetical protein
MYDAKRSSPDISDDFYNPSQDVSIGGSSGSSVGGSVASCSGVGGSSTNVEIVRIISSHVISCLPYYDLIIIQLFRKIKNFVFLTKL